MYPVRKPDCTLQQQGPPMQGTCQGIASMLGGSVFIADSAGIIGDVLIGADFSIWFGSVARGGANTPYLPQFF